MNVVLDKVDQKVATEMNDNLCRPFNTNEVLMAMQDICLDISLRVDGIKAMFYQNI